MVVHLMDARDILGRDDASLPFAFVGDGAPQFRNAVLDHDVDARRPGLFAQRLENAVANRDVVADGGLRIAVEACQSMHEIGATDDANHLAVAHDGEALDAAPFHEFDHRLQ